MTTTTAPTLDEPAAAARRGQPGDGPSCPAATLRNVLERIGDKWSVIVICCLGDRPYRFNELRRLTDGITQRMLSSTLRALERDGLVTRTVYPTVPPAVEYALTETGQSLLRVVRDLSQWTDDHLETISSARLAYDARQDQVRP
jgi:DNA-binding HxlR family transcriptional regulator